MANREPSLAQRLQMVGVQRSHAYMIAAGDRKPSLKLAVHIHRELGVKLGPLEDLTDEQVAILSGVAS